MIKKFLFIILACLFSIPAHGADYFTTRYNLCVPEQGSRDWASKLSNDVISIDTIMSIISDDSSSNITKTNIISSDVGAIKAGTFSFPGITMQSGARIGLGAGKGQFGFIDAATDTITSDNADVSINNSQGTYDFTVKTKNSATAFVVNSDATAANEYIGLGTDVDWSTGNVWYLDTSADVDAFIASASCVAGDTIVLGAGTYTVTDDIDVTKGINIVGQGVGVTIITCATASKNVFDVVSANSTRISNLSITTSGESDKAIQISTSTNVVVENVSITMTGLTTQNAISYLDSSGEIRDVTTSNVCSNGTPQIIQIQNTTATDYTLNCYNVKAIGSGTTGSCFAFQSYDTSGAGDSILNLYNCAGTMTGSGGSRYGVWSAGGTDAVTNLYNSTFNGTTADVIQADGATVTVYDTTLVNNTTSGTITLGGYLRTKSLSQDVVRFTSLAASPDVTTVAGPALCISKDTSGTEKLNVYINGVWKSITLE